MQTLTSWKRRSPLKYHTRKSQKLVLVPGTTTFCLVQVMEPVAAKYKRAKKLLEEK